MLTINKIGYYAAPVNIQSNRTVNGYENKPRLKTLERDTVSFTGIGSILKKLITPKPLPEIIKKEMQELPGFAGSFMKEVNKFCNGSPNRDNVGILAKAVELEHAAKVHEEVDRILTMENEVLDKVIKKGNTSEYIKQVLINIKPDIANGKIIFLEEGESIEKAIKRGEKEGKF